MQLQQMFDARVVDPQSFAPVPPLAEYHVRIVESEAKPNKAEDGGYLQVDLEILDPGSFLNAKVSDRLNIFHAKTQVVEIAYRRLSAYCHVTGIFNITDTRQLHNIPFIASIGPQKDNPQYAQVNYVKDIHGNQPGKAAVGGGAPQPPAPVPGYAPKPAAPGPPFIPGPPAPPLVAHNPVAAAEADGWLKHPQNPAYHYKGAEVVESAKLGDRYPAPVAAPAFPAAPPAVPAVWPGAAAAAAPQPPAAAWTPTGTASGVPDWAK